MKCVWRWPCSPDWKVFYVKKREVVWTRDQVRLQHVKQHSFLSALDSAISNKLVLPVLTVEVWGSNSFVPRLRPLDGYLSADMKFDHKESFSYKFSKNCLTSEKRKKNNVYNVHLFDWPFMIIGIAEQARMRKIKIEAKTLATKA